MINWICPVLPTHSVEWLRNRKMRQTLHLRRQLSPLESMDLQSPSKPQIDGPKTNENEKKALGIDFLKHY